MFNISNWLWPQWTIIALWGITLLIEVIMHDKPQAGKYNIVGGILGMAVAVWLLGSGGFFK